MLKNVLLAYSRRNISIGYCQGFNFIVGRLLKVFNNEEETFWVFTQILEDILPVNYFAELAGMIIDCSILIKLLKVYLPYFYIHLENVGYEVTLSNIIYKWFISLFIQNISLEMNMLIWDLLFLDRSIVLFKSSIVIFKMLKKKIMNSKDFEEINRIFEESARDLKDTNTMIYYLILHKFSFDNYFVESNRIMLEPQIVKNINNDNKIKLTRIENDTRLKRKASYAKSCLNCFIDWPLCIYDLSYKYNIISNLCLRVYDAPILVENYFFDFNEDSDSKNCQKSFKIMDDECMSYDIDLEIELENYKNLLIERKKHMCEEDCMTIKSVYIDDSFTMFEQKEIDNSYVEIKNNSLKDVRKRKKSETMKEYVEFSLPAKEYDSVYKLVSGFTFGILLFNFR
jgi:hypothetical protein